MKLHRADLGCPGRLARPHTRREFLQTGSNGFGLLALAGLMAENAYAGLAAKPHFAAKAKHVIFCFMDGGPSHVDTFDHKPALTKYQGKPIGESAVSKLSQSTAGRVWFGSPWKFEK